MGNYCFVIMPFSKTKGYRDETYWTKLFEKFIKPSVEALGYRCECSKAQSSNIIKDILRELLEADLVIAVLTDFNANVWYELGTRHALCRGTVMIIQKGQKLPFDIQQHGVIFYDGKNPDKNKFQAELKDFVEDIEKHQDADSPAQDFFLQSRVKPAWLADTVQDSGFEFTTLVRQARRRLFVIGQNLNFLANDKFKTELFNKMEADKQFKVDIMICHDDPDIVKVMSEFTDPPFAKDLGNSVKTFTQWQNEANQKKLLLTIKWSKNLGTLSLTFVDPDEDTGKLLLTPVTYRSHSSNRPCFWLAKKKHPWAFDSYFATYETLFRTMAEKIC